MFWAISLKKYINQKAFGAYYTRPEITEYMCERTIHALILDGVNTRGIPGVVPPRQFASIGDLLINLDAALCRKLIYEVLPNLRLLDPACGSAAFLVAAMRTLINIYAAVIGKDPVFKRYGTVVLAQPGREGAPQRELLHQEDDHHRKSFWCGYYGGGG